MTHVMALANGTELVGDFRIERVLGAGGFGITYLAEEHALARRVTIKEYFPTDYAARGPSFEAVPRSGGSVGDYAWGLERFIEEAQALARFDHPNILRVYRYFRANNTGYMVLQFEEGQSLKDWLKGLGRAPRQAELDRIVAPLLDALATVHDLDYLHRDIAPDNIMIRPDGSPVLIDFGAARGDIAQHSRTLSALVKPGYSPYEQYAEKGSSQGPWTDIYALAATLYHCVVGKRPPDAPSRIVKDEIIPAREAAIGAFRRGFLDAIDRALALDIDRRPPSVAAWRGDLLAPDPARRWFGGSAPEPKPPEDAVAAPLGGAVPPPPDVEGPRGRLADYMENFVAASLPRAVASRLSSGAVDELPTRPKGSVRAGANKVAQGAGASVAATPKADAKAGAKAASKAQPKATPTGKLKPDPASTPKVAAKAKAEPNDKARPVQAKAETSKPRPRARADEARDVVAVPAAQQKAPPRHPRPRRERGSAWRGWAGFGVKLAIGTAIAWGAATSPSWLPVLVAASSHGTGTAQQDLLLVRQFKAHDGGLTSARYANDGNWIVTTGADARMTVWNTRWGNAVRSIALDHGKATALAVSGRTALTGHADGTTSLWSLDDGQRTASFRRNEANIWSVALTGGSNPRAITAAHDWSLSLWDSAKSERPLQVFSDHENAVQAVAVTADGALIASGGADRTVRLWDVASLSLKRTLRGHGEFVTAAAFSADQATLATGDTEGTIRLWSAESGRRLRQLRGHTGGINVLAFTPDGRQFASASADGTVRLWNRSTGRTVRTFGAQGPAIVGLDISPDGQQLIAANADGVVRIWRMRASDN